jgi:type I restriction enzyme S subunit
MSETVTHIEKKTSLVPELRFKDFYGEWSSIKLKKRSSLLKDGSHGTHKEVVQSPYFLLSAKNIREGGIEYDESDRRISESDYESIYKNYNLLKDDILLTIVGTIGRVAKYNGLPNLAFQRSVAFFRFEKDVPDFIFQSFQTLSFQRELDKRKVVSAQPGIYLGDLAKISISAPSLPEQQKIASFLSAVDQKIQLLTRKKELLEQYKKGVMQQLFSQQIRFKDADGKEFPAWQTKRLSHFLTVSKRINTDMEYDKSDVLSVSGEYGIVNQIEFQGRSFAGESVHNYGVVETGDIVYTKSPLKSNPYGIIKVNKGKPGIVSTLYAVYTVKDNSIGEYFDYYFQLDDNTNSYLRPLVHKGAKNDMKISNARVLIDPITVPSKKEQMKICQYLNALDVKIEETREQLTQTQTFKKGLLQKMFV